MPSCIAVGGDTTIDSDCCWAYLTQREAAASLPFRNQRAQLICNEQLRRFTGLRPGEKLFEELFHGKEAPSPTAFEGLLVATPRTADAALVGRAIDEVAAACRGGNPRAALAQLARLVPEFDHNADASVGRTAP